MGRWRPGARSGRHRQGYRPQDFRLSRRKRGTGQATGERSLSASHPGDDDITMQDGISFEEMLAPDRADSPPEAHVERNAADLEAVFHIPVHISVLLPPP